MKIIRTILQGILDHSSDLIRQRSRLSDPSITQQIEQLSTSARIIFDLYRLECGLNKQFVHNSDMYTVYMSLLTQTGCDIEEILRLMKAVEALGLDVGIAFYVRVLYLCSRIKNLQLAATVYTTMVTLFLNTIL